MHDLVGIDLHKIERLCAVDPGQRMFRRAEVHRVAGGRGDGHRHTGEQAMGCVVQMTGEDAANIRPADDLRKSALAVQLEQRHELERRRDRRMVHREQRAVRRRGAEHAREPAELGVGHVAVVVSGNGAVERDDAQSVDVVDAILGLCRSRLIKQLAGKLESLVVVAHDPDDLCTHPRGRGLDDLAQSSIRVGLCPVREVTRENDRLGIECGAFELHQRPEQVLLWRDLAVERPIPSEEMRVTDVGDDVHWRGILSELDHATTLICDWRGLDLGFLRSPAPFSLLRHSFDLEYAEHGLHLRNRQARSGRDIRH